MVPFFFLTVALALASPGQAEIPPLLKEVFAKARDTSDRWAYTETTTTQTHDRGKEKTQVTIIRFDPSQPYAEQYRPVQVNSHPPTERDLKKYREKGKKRGEAWEKTGAKPRIPQGDELVAKVDLAHIAVTDETESAVTYSVPLRKGVKMRGVALDKFHLLIRINKERRILESFTVTLRESMRVKLVANIKSGVFSVDFSAIDPKYPVVMTRLQGNADLTLFFLKKLTADLAVTRTDYKRVTPYNDRFGVEIGPLNVLEL